MGLINKKKMYRTKLTPNVNLSKMLLLEIHMKGELKTAQPIRTDKEEMCPYFTTVATFRERPYME
jgi:hypothetical protein